MEFRKVLALRGPNRWTDGPALEAWVAAAPDAVAALVGHAAALQVRAGHGQAVPAGSVQPTSDPAVLRAVIPYREEALARAALEAAARVVEGADFGAEARGVRELAHQVCLGPSTASIVSAAEARGIPARRLVNDGSLVQLGHGVRQRRIWTAETDQTGVIAEAIAQDKALTKVFLRSVGVPVPWGRVVTSAEDAWAAAREIGGPVVVKPRDGNQGRGVATNLTAREQVMHAYEAAIREGEEVLVEQYAPGDDYRLLVIGGRLIAAARREPAQVVGDGRSTIRRLVDVANEDPRRSDDHATALSRIYLDEIALAVLAEQGFTPDSVPPAGRRVLIRRNANLSTGGTAVDVTDRVHPEVAARAVDAAKAVGLDIAGIDLVCEDVGRPMEEQGAMVVEVNAGPGLRMHLEPSAGKPRPVGAAIIDMLFPDGHDGRVPTVAVTGTNGKTTTTRLIAHILADGGRTTVGMTCTDGVQVGGRLLEAGDCSGPRSARAVLGNPAVEAAVLEVARGGILREGLGFDRCHVAVVTNIGSGDHLGMADVHSVEELAQIKQAIVRAVAPSGYAVLKADDPLTAAMATACPGRVIFFARRGDEPTLSAHLRAGGRAAFVGDGAIVLAEGDRRQVLARLSEVRMTFDGRVGFQVENALAAAAACWGLGVGLPQIRAGLAGFRGDAAQAPGRFNVLEGGGVTAVVDYGHNSSALEALAETLDRFPAARRIALYSAAGDRRDTDLIEQGALLAGMFDRLVFYEEAEWRYDRPVGRIAELLRRGAERPDARVSAIDEVPDERTGVRSVLDAAEPGDLLLFQASFIADVLAAVGDHLSGLEARGAAGGSPPAEGRRASRRLAAASWSD